MRSLIFPALFFLFFVNKIAAQQQMFQRLSAPVSQNGVELEYPFAGGLNNPQFSAPDLNNDGILDLVLFDRAGDVLLTFLNRNIAGQTSYTFAPEYACFFPKLLDYALLRDYNKDGAYDIFCSSLQAQDNSQEMQVYRGYFDDNVLKFTPVLFHYPNSPNGQVYDPRYIWYPSFQPGFWSNLSIAKSDVPAVDDIDGDGDLDIVTFAAGATTHLSFFRNQAVEMGFSLDSLQFRLVDDCWGRFFENGLEACAATLSSSPDCCAPCFWPGEPVDDRAERHPGATVLTYDQDGDGDKDVVLGNISFECLGGFTNGGNAEQAWMTALDTFFPSYNTSVMLANFPAAFHLDLNNDGKKDLVVSPNNATVGEDRKCVWYYPNNATSGNHFELSTKTLFVDEMVDVGSASHPVIVDVDGNGLLDLVVGNSGFYTPNTPNGNSSNASLYLFLNTGTPTQPRFNLVDNDWLDLSEYAQNNSDFAPAFGDLDSDGDLDLLVGNAGGWLFYYRNTAGPNNPMTFQQDFNPMWVDMDVATSSTPAIVDLDGDGLQDVIYGEYQGNINFFKNIGTAFEPLFGNQPVISKIGGIDTDITPGSEGYSAPVFVQTPDGLNLITGSITGELEAYSNVTATEAPYTPISLTWGNIDVGRRSSPAVADLDNDGVLELVVGNQRGGLEFYKTVLVDCVVPVKTEEPAALVLSVSPNPARDWVRVQLPTDASARWRAYNTLGQLAGEGEAAGGNLNFSVRHWEPGVYFLEVIAGQQRGVAKVVVRR